MDETLKELAVDLAVIHEALERAEVIERQLGVYWREFEAERDQLKARLEAARRRSGRDGEGGEGMKLHIWTDEVSYLAVCHADSVADAREMLALEVGGQDGSCPERAKAWKGISENTSAPYNGRVAAFCLSDSAEVREQLAYSEKVCAERDAANARCVALEAELAEARQWKAKWETCEKWRKAYQEAKGELFAMGGEIAEASIQHLPCNEAAVDRWFRAEYVHKSAFDSVTAELAEARKDGERRAACMTRVHTIASRQREAPADINDSVALVRICTEIEAARGTR